MQKYLLLGSTGLLGSAFYSYLKSNNFVVVSPTRSELDLLDFDALEKYISDHNPDFVINCAGYNLVDKAEEKEHQNICFHLNVDVPKKLAESASKYNYKLVHYSSDYVFDGKNENGYLEDDKPNPINHYGYTKMLSENVVRSNSPEAIIQRVCWLYGPYKDNFVSFLAEQLSSGNPVKVITDQYGKPTYSFDVVKATMDLLNSGSSGLFHTPNSDVCTWFELAEAVAGHFGADKSLITPITAKELNRLAERPKYSILNTSKCPPMRSHAEALKEYLDNKN